MASKGSNLPVWLITNAWREIFARLFDEDFKVQFNVTPAWLVNPATNRRLKLDLLYPDIGVAVRFEGLRGKQRKSRPSSEEEVQERFRTQARHEACRQHGIFLIQVDLVSGKPQAVFQSIDAALSRAGQQVTAHPPPPRL